MQDPYAVLGVDRNASLSDIKKAYKTQAMKNHPDKGGDEKKFKEINNAYTTITRETNDSPFDVFQREMHTMFSNGFHFHTEPLFKQARVYEVRLSLEAFFTGKTLNVDGQHINVPMNLPINSIIHVPNRDIKIRLKAKKHAMFSLDMYNNLILSEQISLFEALTGFKKKIKLPSGKSVLLQTNKCVEPNQTFVVRHHGMPSNNGFTHLLVNLKVIFPVNIDFSKHLPALQDIFNCRVPPMCVQPEDTVIDLRETIN